MSKYNSTLRHPSHRTEVYNFMFHSYIPCTYIHKKRISLKLEAKNRTQMGQPTHPTNLETHLRTMTPLQ